MNNIVAIVGSPKPAKQSRTCSLVNDFINSLRSIYPEIKPEIISLSESNIGQCRGCMTCKKNGRCVINDNLNEVKQTIYNSDMLILASPVHFRHVSSIFQNFIERMLVDLHTFEYLGKPYINMVTTNGSGEDDADKYLTKIGYLLGAVKIGSIFRSDNDKFDEHTFTKTLNRANDILRHNKKIKPGIMNKLYFSSMKSIIKKNPSYFEYENTIWSQRNWFNKSYAAVFKEKQVSRGAADQA
jgi:multimeric flavodoxin WrbA